MSGSSYSAIDGSGCNWTYQSAMVVGTSYYPADSDVITSVVTPDLVGAATTTNTLSVLNGTRVSQLLGFRVVVAGIATSTISFVIQSGAALSGMTFPADSIYSYMFTEGDDGVALVRLTNANLGCKSAVGTPSVIWFWRKLA